MADESRSEDELPYVCEFLTGLDPNLINVMRQIGDIDDAEIEIEMVENFTKQEISNARIKAFEAAKDKAARCLHQADAGGIFGPKFASEPMESDLLSKHAVSQWELVIRRKVNNFAKDTLDLLNFTLTPDAVFPAKVVKTLSLNKGSFERVPEAEELAYAKLSEDLELSNGNYTVDIVNVSGDRETHLITVATDDPRNETSSDSESEQSEASNPVDYDAAKGGDEKPESEEISNHNEPSDKVVADPLIELVKNFVDMSRRMLEAISGGPETPKSASQYHIEYIEKLTHENANNVRLMLKWKAEVDARLDRIEKARASQALPTPPPIQQINVDEMSDNENEPPFNAVSQRRNADSLPGTSKIANKESGDKAAKGARIQFPPRSIHKTPNPRLVQKGATKDNDSKGNPTRETTGRNGDKRQSFEDVNPYAPLSDESMTEQIEPTTRKSPSFGRGRGRKRGAQNKPGAINRQAPAKQTRSASPPGKVTPSQPTHRDMPNARPMTPAVDVSSSWYDEDDEEADHTMASTTGQHDSDDYDAGKEESATYNDHQRDPPSKTTDERRLPIPKPGADKSRKRTSTKEAPVEPQQGASSNGKSTAPLSKKPKTDTKTPPNGKTSYAGTLEKDRDWNTAKGKNKRRSRLGNKRIPELKSAAEVSLMEVYIQELDCSTCRGSREFEEMVLAYCKRRDLKAVDACTIPVKNSRTKSGCKLTVHEADYDTAMRRDFWPRGCSVRPWNSRPRNESTDDDDGSSSE